MNDSDLVKISNLATIQQTFPNDDLKLYETTITTEDGTVTTSAVPAHAGSATINSKHKKSFLFNHHNHTEAHNADNKYFSSAFATPIIASNHNSNNSNFTKVFFFVRCFFF